MRLLSQSVRGKEAEDRSTGKEQLTQIVRTEEEEELNKGLCSMKRVICSRILIGRSVSIVGENRKKFSALLRVT